MRFRSLFLALFLGAFSLFAQRVGRDQVKWSLNLEPAAAAPGSHVLARLTGRIDPGWHMYSMSTPAAIPTTIKLTPNPAVAAFRVFQPAPHRTFDQNFQSDTETYDKQVDFLVDLTLAKSAAPGPGQVAAEVRYQTCNDRECIPPVTKTAAATLTVDPAAAMNGSAAIPPGYALPGAAAPAAPAQEGMLGFLLVAFGFGLAAIFTPCVFPMIPITMSYFLNRQSGSRREGVFQAVLFCLGIVVLFSGLGLAATAILGPFGVVQLGSNPWVNGFIALIFFAFGLSLLGAFEITIPSSVLTRLDSASRRGGVLGTLLMGLTFSLASFACVGPFVGSLLAASVQGGGARPLAGMVSFASGLALPFFGLALFPSYLKRLPKAGGWMARIKVVMGFVLLAAMLKYLSSVDQVLQWNLITRERFLAAWIVLFAMAGLYLLGYVRLEGVDKDAHMGLPRLLAGMAFLVFAISLIPGMLGGKLGELDAYVPAPSSSAGAAASSEGGLAWMKNQYPEALARARAEGKLVLVSFTGYACTNCHWMKANLFTRPEVAAAMKDFVLVELYTDGTDDASRANQDLEQSRFSTIAIPYYAVLDPEGNVVASFPGATRDAGEYLGFLQKAAAHKPAPAAAPAPAQQAAADPPLGAPLSSLDGGPFDARPLAGKVLVVNFWATYCVPCVQEIPGFNRMHQQLASRGVAVLGVSMDEDGDAPLVKQFLQKHPMRYPVALGNEQLKQRFHLDELPVTVVFDRTGKLVERFEGFTPDSALEKAVQTAL